MCIIQNLDAYMDSFISDLYGDKNSNNVWFAHAYKEKDGLTVSIKL